MMNYSKALITTIIVLNFFIKAQAFSLVDDDSIQNTIETKLSKIDAPSHLEVYMNFLSKVSYLGRYYGTSGVGLYPSLVYKLKSGFEAGVTNNVWTGFTPVLNQSEVTLGYTKNIRSWFGIEVGYARTFMYYGSDSDKLAMPNALNLNIGIYPSWANVGLDYAYMFGYDKASVVHATISKDFIIYQFLGSDKISISPGIGSFWGPQTAFYHYFSKNAVKNVNRGNSPFKTTGRGLGNGKGNSGGTTSTTTTTTTTTISYEETASVESLDYQFNLPVDYRSGHFAFELALHLDLPVHLPSNYLYGSGPLTTFSGYLKYIF